MTARAEPSAAGWLAAALERRFALAAARTTVQREVLAGLTTFLTMSYILLVNPVILGAAGTLGGISVRRRRPRAFPDPPPPREDPPVPDSRWLAAGEPKAVAARAAHVLRAAVATRIPEAHAGLSTTECLDVVERHLRDATLPRALRDLLTALDHVAYANAPTADIAPLAAQARALAGKLSGSP